MDGICTLANDRVYDQLVALLNSIEVNGERLFLFVSIPTMTTPNVSRRKLLNVLRYSYLIIRKLSNAGIISLNLLGNPILRLKNAG